MKTTRIHIKNLKWREQLSDKCFGALNRFAVLSDVLVVCLIDTLLAVNSQTCFGLYEDFTFVFAILYNVITATVIGESILYAVDYRCLTYAVLAGNFY